MFFVLIFFISGKQDQNLYFTVLEDGRLLLAENTVEYTFIFHQNNSGTYLRNYTQEWLNLSNVYTLLWPAKSLDMNLIENLLGILTRAVCRNQCEFTFTQDLEVTTLD